VSDDGKHLYVTLVAVAGKEDAPTLVSVECVLGSNWVVTSHREEIAVLEEFLERAEGGGQVGALDAPSLSQRSASGCSPATCVHSRQSRAPSRSSTQR
jgi:hypothetical protein